MDIRIVACLIALFVVAGSSLPSEARSYRIKHGNWKGGSYTNSQTGKFSHCAVSARYKRGDSLVFSIDRQYKFSVGVADKRWKLRQGSQYDVTMQVDRGRRYFRSGAAVSPTLMKVPIGDRVSFFNLMRRGNQLTISGGETILTYSLRGTHYALKSTLKCVRVMLRGQR